MQPSASVSSFPCTSSTSGASPDGLILVAQPVVQTIFSPVTGRLSDRIEPRIVATAGMAIIVLGLTFFKFLKPSTPLNVIVANLMVLGFGYGLFSSPNTNAIMSSAHAKHLGLPSGMVATIRSLGQLLSMAIAMSCFAIFIGPVMITPGVYQALMTSQTVAFMVFTVLCILGVWASCIRVTIYER